MGVSVAALVVAPMLGACDTGDDGKAAGEAPPGVSSPAAGASGDASDGASGGAGTDDMRPVDACAVLTAEQVSRVLAIPGLVAAPNPIGCDYAVDEGIPVVSTIATRSTAPGGVDAAIEAYLGTLGDARTETVTGVGDRAVYVQPDTFGGVLVVAVRKGDETAVFSLNAGGAEPPPGKEQLIALAEEAVARM